MSSLGVAEGEVMAESEAGAEGETDDLILELDEVSTTVMLVSELVMICIALVSSVPVLGLGFVSCEESVSWGKVVDWRSGEEGSGICSGSSSLLTGVLSGANTSSCTGSLLGCCSALGWEISTSGICLGNASLLSSGVSLGNVGCSIRSESTRT